MCREEKKRERKKLGAGRLVEVRCEAVQADQILLSCTYIAAAGAQRAGHWRLLSCCLSISNGPSGSAWLRSQAGRSDTQISFIDGQALGVAAPVCCPSGLAGCWRVSGLPRLPRSTVHSANSDFLQEGQAAACSLGSWPSGPCLALQASGRRWPSACDPGSVTEDRFREQ